MARKTRKQTDTEILFAACVDQKSIPALEAEETEAEETEAEETEADETEADETEADETEADETEAEEEYTPRSVVKGVYKRRYAERAEAKGTKDKAAKRSCGDWLADQLAKLVLRDDKKRSLDFAALTALLDANGVRYDAWKREGKGWQGRFRMTSRLRLQAEVADQGFLRTADGTEIRAPRAWCERIQR